MKKTKKKETKRKYTRAQREKMFKPTYFFGYGSLMMAKGVNDKYLSHIYVDQELMEACLVGYERSMCGYYAGRNFYGLLKKKSVRCNGVVFKIHSWADYRSLLGSEGGTASYGLYRTYWPIDVTRLIQNWMIPAKHRVIALVCKEDRTGKGLIEAGYIRKCWQFAKQRGDAFTKEFLKTGGMEYDIEKLRRDALTGKIKLYRW